MPSIDWTLVQYGAVVDDADDPVRATMTKAISGSRSRHASRRQNLPTRTCNPTMKMGRSSHDPQGTLADLLTNYSVTSVYYLRATLLNLDNQGL